MLGLALLSTIAPDTSYPVVISFFCIMAVGMGMTMAPATESVMGSLPREKAGVGSAVNDTTRQVGGALGVAIIGTAVTSGSASRIGTLSATAGLSQSSTYTAQTSLGGAQRIGATLGEGASSFIAEANKIFVDSMAIGLRVSTIVVGIALVMAWRFLPARAHTPATAGLPEAKPDSGSPIERDSEPVAEFEPHVLFEPARRSATVAPPATVTLEPVE
jgi:hypothetical protein